MQSFFDMQMQVSEMDEKLYQKYVVFLRETLHNDVSINSYLRDFITTMHFLMREGYLPHFKMQSFHPERKSPVVVTSLRIVCRRYYFQRRIL
ncbi:MAG: phage integrase SAM-like domain-containing protein [Clostridia bacterium]|nr:phage integrase SAM-like domain-containing protein [Clostridia bacterium]